MQIHVDKFEISHDLYLPEVESEVGVAHEMSRHTLTGQEKV